MHHIYKKIIPYAYAICIALALGYVFGDWLYSLM